MYAAIYIFINQNSMKTVGDSHLYEGIQGGRHACLFSRSIPEDEIEWTAPQMASWCSEPVPSPCHCCHRKAKKNRNRNSNESLCKWVHLDVLWDFVQATSGLYHAAIQTVSEIYNSAQCIYDLLNIAVY